MDTREIIDSLIDIEQQKSISKQKVVDVIKQGLIKACEKQFGEDGKYVVNINEATGEIIITRMIEVVNDVSDSLNQISIDEAREFADDIKEGDELQEKLTIKSFGRLAINAMKQHITNELLEEERISLFNEFSGKIDNLVNGSIKKITPSRVYINLNRLEAIMPMDETIPGERYRIGQLIKAVIIDVEENKGDPRVYLSRRSDKFLKRLMEFEVPEIEDGTVIIKGIARMPGIKSKIAVMSIDDKIDPVGACVGVKGSRIRTIIKELNNEHIDIIQWSYDSIIFTQRVISPGVVIRAFKNEEEMKMKLVVKDDTYEKAIGRDSINLNLACDLTGWDIEVESESSFNEPEGGELNKITEIDGLTDNMKDKLIEHGYNTPDDIVEKGMEGLKEIDGIGKKTAEKIIQATEDFIKGDN